MHRPKADYKNLAPGEEAFCYQHMPICKVWIYRLLFVCLFLCTVTDFSVEDKASYVLNVDNMYISVSI